MYETVRKDEPRWGIALEGQPRNIHWVAKKLNDLTEQRDELLKACNWINDIISTASDGGDAWCAIRNQPGAKEWSNDMKQAINNAQ